MSALPASHSAPAENEPALIEAFALGAPPWKTFDPFLFCVHHVDAYPTGNPALGPAASLTGRQLGSDFDANADWRMYHGHTVPGFPRHPHRGFETVTVTRRGHIDHSDSLGATARYGEGDVQWMTAGRGIAHAEMFPLLNEREPNPAELFQIWINLPRVDKFADPHFAMFWKDSIPRQHVRDVQGRSAELVYFAGAPGKLRAPAPPPHSWAARADAEVAIWTIALEPGARWDLPKASAGLNRTLYYFAGETLQLGTQFGMEEVSRGQGLRLRSDVAVTLHNGARPSELLLLQGRPIDEPIVRHGPFVMNERQQIREAIADYRANAFGGWPWKDDAPVHARDKGRFAIHADGREEKG
jgi:redox-sensitive bicupin YhaK (pirin superfamily)